MTDSTSRVEDSPQNTIDIVRTTKYSFHPRLIPLGMQMLFVAFGALVLVPILTGLEPNVALFTAGLGTLVFQILTRGKVPVFLASSFAFIAPITAGVASFGLPATLGGLVGAGLVYVVLSVLVSLRGVEILHKVLPPIVTGPVIMLIGLSLAPVAIDMATGSKAALVVSSISLLTTALVALLGRGMVRFLPIVIGIVTGYIVALFFRLVDFTPLQQAAWFGVPNFTFPVFNIKALLFMLPVTIAPMIEHFGDVVAISKVTGEDYLTDPGINMTLLGDGLATSLAAMFGGPPNTTYSEVTGAVTLTRAFNPAVMTIAALTAILLAFVGKLGAFLQTIPAPVMGGILVILFGSIVVVGMNSLVEAKQDLTKPRNLVIISVMLIFGIGGLTLQAGGFSLEGIGLAGVAGVFLNLVLPQGFEFEEN